MRALQWSTYSPHTYPNSLSEWSLFWLLLSGSVLPLVLLLNTLPGPTMTGTEVGHMHSGHEMGILLLS